MARSSPHASPSPPTSPSRSPAPWRVVVPSGSVGAWAATLVQSRIEHQAKPLVLGLPTGSTPLTMYAALVEAHVQGNLDFAEVVTFNLDEYVGLTPDHPQSFAYYLRSHLLDRVNLPATHSHWLDGQAVDLAAACEAYEEAIAAVGGLDLVIGGVGENGHIAFNEPGTPASQSTHVVTLSETTRRANARFFGGQLDQVPTQALTMGLGTILAAREIVILATGEKKREAVQRALSGILDPNWPISLLNQHPRVTLVCDEASLSASL